MDRLIAIANKNWFRQRTTWCRDVLFPAESADQQRATMIEARDTLTIAVAAVVAYAVVKLGLSVSRQVEPTALYGMYLLGLGFGIAFAKLRYEFGDAFRIIMRGITLVLGFYALTAYPSFESFPLQLCRWLAVACAIAAWWRPSFVVPVCLYSAVAKGISGHLLGIAPITSTDYIPVVELGVYLALGVAIYTVAPRKPKEIGFPLVLIAVAVHFGNYFYSAVRKVQIGIVEWIFGNDTQNLILVTAESGNLPIAHWPELTDFAFDSFGQIVVLANLVIFGGQLLSIVAINRVKWAIWITLFYDFTHVVIFIVTGIFFWKWILLNAAIVLALFSARRKPVQNWLKLTVMGFVVCGTFVFYAARLGWYDTSAMVHHYFVAVAKDGREYRVPSNFFLTGSVKVAQQRLGTFGRQYPLGTWGSTKSKTTKAQVENDCSFTRHRRPRGSVEALKTFVRNHHRYVLDNIDEDGRIRYDLYPHHIFSNPFLYTDFYLLDKRNVDHYVYVVESVCFEPRRTDARAEIIVDRL